MPFLFVDDGYPEASDYDSNYFWYDPEDPESLREAEEKAKRLQADRRASAAPRRASAVASDRRQPPPSAEGNTNRAR